MLRKLDQSNMGSSDLGWLRSKFHFSFANYQNPDNINFGKLRVINDDLVLPQTGFDTHPHRDMEIVSYVVEGELTHGDSMGNQNTISRGQIQYMSAGTGVWHSEHNLGTVTTRFLQIWIYPDQKNLQPQYGDYRFPWEDRKDQWLHMVSGTKEKGTAPVQIHQDANLYSLELDEGKEIGFSVSPGRQAYLVQIEGISQINGVQMMERDGMEIVEEELLIQAQTTSHFILIELNKEAS